MQAVMKDGVHYGKVPGCGDKPTLLKPGAEKILATFRLAANPEIEDLSSRDEIRYRIKTAIISSSGLVVGYGVGECSTAEEKYKWKKAICEEEWAETPEDRRREKWSKGWNEPASKTKQVRTNIADIANTILKMAKKRSLVDGCLTATACSDIFAQDLEDLEGVVDIKNKPPVKPIATPKSKNAVLASELTVTTGIAKITASKGVNKTTGQEFTLYKILGEGEIIYSTFDEKLATLAKTASDAGLKAGITHKADKYNSIVAIDILDAPNPVTGELSTEGL